MVHDAKIVEAFRRKGYRATPQRIAIARHVLMSGEHPTADVVYSAVRNLHPTLSFSTVYNTLHMLKDLNMVQELSFSDQRVRFDPNTEAHINMVCRRCGKITDLEDPAFREMLERVCRRKGFTLTGQRLDVYGICKACADGKNRE